MFKKIFTLILLAASSASSALAQSQLAVKKSDGTYQLINGKVFFKQNGDKDEWSFAITEDAVYRSNFSISNVARMSVVSGLELELANHKAPAYNDYYIVNGGWEQRSQWNLGNVHDPSVMKAADGYYYMYTTDAGYGNPHSADKVDGKYGHFYCRRSKNLVDWEFMGATMRGLPTWVQPKLNEIRKAMGLDASTANFNDETLFGYWAPCARKVNDNLYRMYYCITCPGYIDGSDTWGERAFIGMMETTDPSDLSKWQDKGYVITNYSDKELNFRVKPNDYANCYFKYNAIDPSYIITPEGEHWLIYGSWHSGFAAVQLNAETGKTISEQGNPWGAENEAAYGKRVFTRQMGNRWQGAEAPEVIYHDGYYYLFMAYDGLDIPYNTRVVRSKNIDGPYYSMNGTNVTQFGGDAFPIVTHPYKLGGDHGWVGISHCAVFEDGEGNWYYASQQRYPANYNGNAYSNAIMLGGVRAIRWTEDGWPVVSPERYAAVPQAEITEEDIPGKWEHITLSYGYGKIRESQSMTLGTNHKVTEGWNKGAEWSFDPSNNVLTIGGLKMYLSREVDWEASPRHQTIVYSGLNNYSTSDTQKTYWGKRVAGLDLDSPTAQIVGNTDFSSAWWTVFSDYYTIPAGKTLHLNFVNHSSKQNNWNNWVVVLCTDAERGASNYSEYFVLRADAYWWNQDEKFSLTHNYNWETLIDDMDGADVDMTITRDGSTIKVDAVMTTVAGKKLEQNFSKFECGDGNQTVRAFLVCDGSWYEIVNSNVE